MKIVYAFTTALLLAGCKADTHPVEKSVEVYPIKPMTEEEKCLASNPSIAGSEPVLTVVPLASVVLTDSDQDLISFSIITDSVLYDEYTSIKQMSFYIQYSRNLILSQFRLRKSFGDVDAVYINIFEPRKNIDVFTGSLPEQSEEATIVVSFKQGIADTFRDSLEQYTLHATVQQVQPQSYIATRLYQTHAGDPIIGYLTNKHREEDWYENENIFHVMIPHEGPNTYALGAFIWTRYPYTHHSPNTHDFGGACDWRNDTWHIHSNSIQELVGQK